MDEIDKRDLSKGIFVANSLHQLFIMQDIMDKILELTPEIGRKVGRYSL